MSSNDYDSIFRKNPGPGHYNPKKSSRYRIARSSFKSKTLRNFFNINKSPPPNRYKISRDLIRKKNYKEKEHTSSFAAPSKRNKLNMVDNFLKFRNKR
jgi:hypothetical protein